MPPKKEPKGDPAVGRRIREARDAMNLTGTQLGARIDSAATSIAHWETGAKAISEQKLAQIARETCVSEEYLRGGRPDVNAADFPEREPLVADKAFRDAPEPVRNWILHLAPARRVSTGKWHQFFETALELYALGALDTPKNDIPEPTKPAVKVPRPSVGRKPR